MTDAPKRWLEANSDVSERARQLLQHGRPTPMMPAEVRAASAASVAKLGGSATAAGGAGLKLLLGGLALTAGVGALIAVSLPETEPPRPVDGERAAVQQLDATEHEETEHEETVPAEILPPAEPIVEARPEQRQPPPEEPTPDRRAVPRTPVTDAEDEPRDQVAVVDEPDDDGDSLSAEVALIERARSQLGSDPAAALSTAQEHMREFPRGQLAAPAQLLAIDALLRLGRRGEANERARALAARNPSSIYRDRLVSLVGEDALR